MSTARIIALTSLTMLAFACNSLLCRLALKRTPIDAASFTTIRLASGAATLWLVAGMRRRPLAGTGSWLSAAALFVYAAGFSFAYVSLPASLGALLLFGAVQTTMIGCAVWSGERLRFPQIVGLIIAVGGLVVLLSPGLSAPPLVGSVLMLVAGFAWGVYSLHRKGTGDPIRVTAGNFLRALPVAVLLSLLLRSETTFDRAGAGYAILSGALASGLGYAVWYTVLPALKATNAATVQLSVPVLAAIGGVAILGEPPTLRLLVSSITILGGIAVIIMNPGNNRRS